VGTLRRFASFPSDLFEWKRYMHARTFWGLAVATKVARLGIQNPGQCTVGAVPFAAVLSSLIVLRDGTHELLWSLAVASAGGLSAAFGTMLWTAQARCSVRRCLERRRPLPHARHLTRPRYPTRERPDGPFPLCTLINALVGSRATPTSSGPSARRSRTWSPASGSGLLDAGRKPRALTLVLMVYTLYQSWISSSRSALAA